VKGDGVKLDRTIIVIGGFLSVIGLAVAWNGYSYVEVERGWSMLIAGTVGFCTGLVLVALGLILRQLAEIASSASKAALLLAKAKAGGLPEISIPAPPAPVAREEDKEVQSIPVQAAIPVEPKPVDPDWEPEWEPQWELEQALAAEARKNEPGEPGAAAGEPEEESEMESERPLAWTIRKDTEAKPVEAEAPGETKPAPAGDEWLYKTISGPLAGIHEPAPAENLHVEEPAAEAWHEPEPSHALEASHAHGEEFVAHAEEPAANPATPTEPVAGAARPEVIGHYDAQGAHYTMYADGSIDAETVHGVYRFASMEELKSFIEGQE
jgi:hypothetical protein